MENNENKKSKTGLIIIIIIIILLLLFALWFFLIRDKKSSGNDSTTTTTSSNINTDNPTSKEKVEYDYKDGVLTQIVDSEGKALQTDFVIDGLILVGNRHSYAGLDAGAEGVLAKLVSKGYNKTGINSSFYLNEWIEFYIDSKYTGSTSDVKIYAVPHKTVEEYQKLSSSQLESLAYDNGGFVFDYQKPEEDNYKYVGEGYINLDYPEGKYDILFTYKGKLAYFVELSLTKEDE